MFLVSQELSNNFNGGGYAGLKLEALKQEKKWFEAFFQNHAPQCHLDSFYYLLCTRIKDKRYEERFIGTIYNGLVWGGSNKIDLLVKGKQLGISNLRLFKMFIRYLLVSVNKWVR